jgi:CHAT domain-containing protein
MNLAEAYKKESQYHKALDILESSIDNQDSKNRLNILSEIGRLYAKSGEIERALEFFNKAFNNYLEKLKQYSNNLLYLENFSLLLESILKISQKSSYIDKALWCNHKSIEIYDSYFIDIGFEDDSFSMSQKMMVSLHRLLDVYILSGKEPNEKLVEALEMVKSKRLKQLMEANHFEKRLDKAQEFDVKQLKMKLDVVKREIAKDSIDIFNMKKKERLYEELQDYSQQLSKLLNLKKDRLDIYQNLNSKSLLIYPIYNGQKLTLIAVEKREKIEVNITQTIIKEDIKFSDYLLFIKYMEDLIEEDKFSDRDALEIINNIKIDKKIKKEILTIDEDEFIEEYKYEIVQIALLHIRDEIIKLIPKGIDKILFAPFGDLNMLPLHAILIEEDSYLIEKYEISYIASLSLMKNLKSNSTTDRVTSKDNLIVSMKGLHGEAKNILESIHGESLKDIETDEFKEYIKDKNFNILHFSTHGSANLSYPLNSHLLFNETKLHLLEIFGLNINANLVNISACETYLSEVKGADEVLAFERAFLIAGAKSVISTFSTVNVMRTDDFMEIFYNKIKKEGGSISKSFQKASIVDIENGSMEWSLFRFIG